jgi:hypothetical protein
MLKALATGATLLASLTATGAPAPAAPASTPSDDMVIDVAAANGSGCPRGSADGPSHRTTRRSPSPTTSSPPTPEPAPNLPTSARTAG